MKAILFGIVLGLTCIFLLNQSALGQPITKFVPFVTLAESNSGYIIKSDQAPITKVKDFTVNLSESIAMDTGEKKPSEKKSDDKKTSDKKTDKKKVEKKIIKKPILKKDPKDIKKESKDTKKSKDVKKPKLVKPKTVIPKPTKSK